MRISRNRLIILGVLVLVLATVVVALNRRTSRQEIVAGSDFSFIASIYGFTDSFGVAADEDGQVYVSNTGMSEVIVYDQDGVEQRKLADVPDEKGEPIRFYSPFGIAVDPDRGKVYICDYNWQGVRVFDRYGSFLHNVPRDPKDVQLDPGIKWTPYSAAVLGDRVYITSRDGVYVFDSEGNFVSRWGGRGAKTGQYDFPNGIAADPETGNLFIADTLNRRLVSTTADGKVRWTLGVKGDAGQTTASLFQHPSFVAVGLKGRVFVTDTFMHQVLVFNQDGKLLSIFGDRGTADGQFNFPAGIAVSKSNRLYVADRVNSRLQIWQLSEDLPPAPADKASEFAATLNRSQN